MHNKPLTTTHWAKRNFIFNTDIYSVDEDITHWICKKSWSNWNYLHGHSTLYTGLLHELLRTDTFISNSYLQTLTDWNKESIYKIRIILYIVKTNPSLKTVLSLYRINHQLSSQNEVCQFHFQICWPSDQAHSFSLYLLKLKC